MSLAAPARTDHVVKLLVTGPFAAGKTTLIGSISETPVVDTDVATTGDEAVVACQLIRPDDGREVIIAALMAALDRLEAPGATPWRTPLTRVIDAIATQQAEAA